MPVKLMPHAESPRLKESALLWIGWMTICVAVSAITLPNLSLWPKITQDEVQIIDLGRVAWNPGTDYSTDWLLHDSMPRLADSYIGAALQELAYSVFAPGNFGSRFSSFIGSLVSATLIISWLRLRGTSPRVTLVISTVFLLDPIFNESYRQGRLDSWAFACIIAACLLIRLADSKKRNQIFFNPCLFSAGFLTVLSPFVWPTAIALFPLICLELYYLLKTDYHRAHHRNAKQLGKSISIFVFGCSISALLLLIPVLVNWEQYFTSLIIGAEVQNAASIIQRSIVDIYGLYDPLLFVAVIVSFILKREIGLLLAISVSIAVMFQTMMYPMRILYLLPYWAVMLSVASTQNPGPFQRLPVKRIFLVTLGVLLAGNIFVSLIKRPLIAHSQAEARSTIQLQRSLESAIGHGPFRVLNAEWDMYYAGRALGWKSYKLFGRYSREEQKFNEFLGKMDYVILRKKFLFNKEVSPDLLNKSGFRLFTTLSFKQPAKSSLNLWSYQFALPKTVYDDVLVYKKISHK